MSTGNYLPDCIEVAFDIVFDAFCMGDLDEDGDVDLADLGALPAVYGQICP